MAEYLVQSGDLTAVAEAIRVKGGTSELLQFPGGFVSAVEAIETGAAENNMRDYIQGQMTALVDPDITAINHKFLFYRDSVLTTIELANAVGRCADAAFYSAQGLQTCILPRITALGDSCFLSSTLANADFSSVESIGQSCFQGCSNLTRLDFPALKSIAGGDNFYGCAKLATLILRSTDMVTVVGSTTFKNTPIASGTGYIYVPADLISTYQADSVWSAYAAQFRAIEDYPNV